MVEIKYVTEHDKEFWFSLDKHLDESEFHHIVELKRGYMIFKDKQPAGVFRWNLFWDSLPFLTMICFEESNRNQEIGRKVMEFWENEMKHKGYKALMTSTEVDETSQHFYRKIGFEYCGYLVLNKIPELEQPMEMFFIKGI